MPVADSSVAAPPVVDLAALPAVDLAALPAVDLAALRVAETPAAIPPETDVPRRRARSNDRARLRAVEGSGRGVAESGSLI